MANIPRAQAPGLSSIRPNNLTQFPDKLFFSFERIEKNDYFNIDATCPNWSADLFDTMQKASEVSLTDIYNGKYTGKTSPFRIHRHQDATAPCNIPPDTSLEEMWQIRISKTKGGIHGLLIDNIFYVIWFDPHHNLYPSKDHGGLTRIRHPAGNCCKDRDVEIDMLNAKLRKIAEENAAYKELFDEQADAQLNKH